MTDAAVSPPPFNLDAEEFVLGAMMLSPRAIDGVIDEGLTQTDFYRGSHGVIFDALRALYLESLPTDPLSVSDRLHQIDRLDAAGGKERLQELAALVPATSNVGHYARIVREHSVLRSLIRAGMGLSKLGYTRPGSLEEIIEEADRIVFEMTTTRPGQEFTLLSETLPDTFKRIEALHEAGSSITGVASGFRTLDALTAGFQPGNLVILAARPSMGKSALALGMLANIAIRQQRTVGLFTLEMSEREITQRLLSSEGRVESGKIRTGRMNGDEWEKMTGAGARIHTSKIYVDDSGVLTSMELRSKARRLKLRHPDLALIVVDYLQLMTSGNSRAESNRVQDVSMISRSMKALARELNVPLLALSQLSRSPEQRHDKRPMLSDLRESGSIEQDADIVMFIYRDDYYNPEDTDQEGIAEVNLAKHRNGETGTIKLAFVKRFTLFADLDGLR